MWSTRGGGLSVVLKDAIEGLRANFETNLTSLKSDKTNPKVKQTHYDGKGAKKY